MPGEMATAAKVTMAVRKMSGRLIAIDTNVEADRRQALEIDPGDVHGPRIGPPCAAG